MTNLSETYDLVIIGGGSAGLSAASLARRFGARVALVDRDRLGGDCTWTGCVPSKALRKVATVAHEMRTADRYGLPAAAPAVDLGAVMAHVRSVIDGIYEEETPEVLRAKGTERNAAIVEAGSIRLRPMLMTNLTTIVALIPLALGRGWGGEMMSPMAMVQIGGLIAGGWIGLLIVPVIYTLYDDFKSWLGRLAHRRRQSVDPT